MCCSIYFKYAANACVLGDYIKLIWFSKQIMHNIHIYANFASLSQLPLNISVFRFHLLKCSFSSIGRFKEMKRNENKTKWKEKQERERKRTTIFSTTVSLWVSFRLSMNLRRFCQYWIVIYLYTSVHRYRRIVYTFLWIIIITTPSSSLSLSVSIGWQ